MKNRRVEVSIGRTINLGDFESLRVCAGLSFDIADNVEMKSSYEEAWGIVETQVGVELKGLTSKDEGEVDHRRRKIRR